MFWPDPDDLIGSGKNVRIWPDHVEAYRVTSMVRELVMRRAARLQSSSVLPLADSSFTLSCVPSRNCRSW